MACLSVLNCESSKILVAAAGIQMFLVSAGASLLQFVASVERPWLWPSLRDSLGFPWTGPQLIKEVLAYLLLLEALVLLPNTLFLLTGLIHSRFTGHKPAAVTYETSHPIKTRMHHSASKSLHEHDFDAASTVASSSVPASPALSSLPATPAFSRLPSIEQAHELSTQVDEGTCEEERI